MTDIAQHLLYGHEENPKRIIFSGFRRPGNFFFPGRW